MAKPRVLVVDDSIFSQKAIQVILKNSEFEICGCAITGQEGIEKYRELAPDMVTMDYTLPDMDGLTCSRYMLAIDPEAKIVCVSAMKDKALIMKGTAIGVRTFLQKPIEPEELISTLQQVYLENKNNDKWQDKYLKYLVAALDTNIKSMTDLESIIKRLPNEGDKFTSHGTAVIIGITGSRHGRIILDMTLDTLTQFTKKMLDVETVSEEDMIGCITEFGNIVAGNSVSQINNNYKDMELRLTPPSILFGDALSVVTPRLISYTVTAETAVGQINMNMGFAGGE